MLAAVLMRDVVQIQAWICRGWMKFYSHIIELQKELRGRGFSCTAQNEMMACF
jgi:hypothetical protein